MSWSASTQFVDKKEIRTAIVAPDIVPREIDGPMLDQLHAAQEAALQLVKSIPGPKVSVTMSGHANGIGWQGKSGWANDTITVTVSQGV